MKFLLILIISALFCLHFSITTTVHAQDIGLQYPSILDRAYFKLGTGYIQYPFSNEQLSTGYTAQRIHIPHAAAALVLFGYQFNSFLAAQISYMRPVKWVQYYNISGDRTSHSV